MFSLKLLMYCVLFGIKLVRTSSHALRGQHTTAVIGSSTRTRDTESHHRHLLEDIQCRLILIDVAYAPTDDHPYGYSKEDWMCELQRQDSVKLGMQYLEIESTYDIDSNVTPGESILTMNKAIVDVYNRRMTIPPDATVEMHREANDSTSIAYRRKMATKFGTLNTLVIRVVDSKGVAPNATTSKLENDVFEDKSCLKSQLDACSYGKLQIRPFSGKTSTDVKIENGVIDVKVDFDLSTNDKRSALQQASFKAAEEQLGDLNDDMYDLVMFCMPPGTGNWVAYAFTNGKYSFYNDVWCSFVSAQMHEVGHNLGLAHSGANGKEYADRQGVMGVSFSRDDQRICFNPAKSYQLEWYADQVKTINPVSTEEMGRPVRQFTLNGIADYGQNQDSLVVLRMEQPAFGKDYYIGYNHAHGINKDTAGDQNMVTIVLKDAGYPTEYGKSNKIGSLSLGDSLVINDYNGERDIEIRFIGLQTRDTDQPTIFRDATIEIVDLENIPSNPDDDEITCEMHTIEMKTDRYPSDNTFAIVEDNEIGRVVAKGPDLVEELTTYTMELCLTYETNYKFIIYDKYKDGICCGQGKGSYRGVDSQGNVIFSSNEEKEKFDIKVEHFRVGKDPNGDDDTLHPSEAPSIRIDPTMAPSYNPSEAPSLLSDPTMAPSYGPIETSKPSWNPTPSPTLSPSELPSNSIDQCQDAKGKFKWKNKKRGRKRNCKWIANKKKCNKKLDGKSLWHLCPKACGKC